MINGHLLDSVRSLPPVNHDRLLNIAQRIDDLTFRILRETKRKKKNQLEAPNRSYIRVVGLCSLLDCLDRRSIFFFCCEEKVCARTL